MPNIGALPVNPSSPIDVAAANAYNTGTQVGQDLSNALAQASQTYSGADEPTQQAIVDQITNQVQSSYQAPGGFAETAPGTYSWTDQSAAQQRARDAYLASISNPYAYTAATPYFSSVYSDITGALNTGAAGGFTPEKVDALLQYAETNPDFKEQLGPVYDYLKTAKEQAGEPVEGVDYFGKFKGFTELAAAPDLAKTNPDWVFSKALEGPNMVTYYNALKDAATSDPSLAEKVQPQLDYLGNLINATGYSIAEQGGQGLSTGQMKIFKPLGDDVKEAAAKALKDAPVSVDDATGGPFRQAVVDVGGSRYIVTGDEEGNLTNATIPKYAGDWVATSQYGWLQGNWDAQGNPNPTSNMNRPSGGFFGDLIADTAPILSVLPTPAQPFAQAYLASQALERGDYAGAILGGLGAAGTFGTQYLNENVLNPNVPFEQASAALNTPMGQFAQSYPLIQTATNVAAGINALDKGSISGLVAAGMNEAFNQGAKVNPVVSTVAYGASAIDALSRNDPAQLLYSVGVLANNPDIRVASSAADVLRAVESGNPAAMIQSMVGMGSTLKQYGSTSDIVQTLKSAGLEDGEPAFRMADLGEKDIYDIQEPSKVISAYNEIEDAPTINLMGDTEVAGPGMAEPPKPNQVNATKDGKLFFTFIDEVGNTRNIPVVRGEGGKIAAAAADQADELARALNRAGVRVATIPGPVWEALVKINPALGQRISIPPQSVISPAEMQALEKAFGKSAVETAVEKFKPFANIFKASPFQMLYDMLTFTKPAGLPREEEERIIEEKFKNATPPAPAPVIPPSAVKAPVPAPTVQPPSSATEYEVKPEDYTDTTEEIQTWQNITPEDEAEVVAKDETGEEITVADLKREIARIEEEIRQEQRQEQKRAEKTETKTEIKTKTETKTKTEVPTPPKTKVAETAKPFGRLPPPPPVYPDISEKAPEPTAAQPEPSLPPVSDAEPKPVEQEAAAPKVQFTRQQAQNIAQAFGQPQLADVFYYGSPFLESKKQKLKKGKLEQEEYEAPSVTKAGRVQAMEEAQAQALEEFAAADETEDNDVNQMLDTILGSSSDSASLDEIMRIAQGV